MGMPPSLPHDEAGAVPGLTSLYSYFLFSFSPYVPMFFSKRITRTQPHKQANANTRDPLASLYSYFFRSFLLFWLLGHLVYFKAQSTLTSTQAHKQMQTHATRKRVVPLHVCSP